MKGLTAADLDASAAAGVRIELVTRGDDAGGSRSANLAIRECAVRGLLRNASVMAVGSALEHAAEVLTGLPNLCLGLHLCLSSEWDHPRFRPVLPGGCVPTLLDVDGAFTRSPNVLHDRGFDLDEAEAEMRAQLERVRGAGLDVAYVDQHMGFGWVPGLAERVARLAEREGLIDVDLASAKLSGIGDPTSWRGKLTAAAPGRYVLITHPMVDDDEARGFVRDGEPKGLVAANRNRERLALTDPDLIGFCREHGIVPVRFDEPSAF